MGIFLGLFTCGITCILIGVLLSAIIIVCLYFCIIAFNPQAKRSIPFYVSTCFTFLALLVNASAIIGALKIKEAANDALYCIESISSLNTSLNLDQLKIDLQDGNFIDALLHSRHTLDDIDLNTFNELKSHIGDNWDLIKLYFGSSEISTAQLIISPTSAIKKFNDKMNSLIWSKILWTLVFIILTIVIGISTSSGTKEQSSYAYRRTNSIDDDF